jgi:transposase
MAEPVRARRLSDEEGRRLQQIVRRGRHESIRVRRALIIMASASGTPVPAIARLVAAHEDTVRDVIHRFNEIGLRALATNPLRRVHLGRERLRQLLRRNDISFQRTRTWKESHDPDKEAKLDRIEAVTATFPDRCFAFDQFGPLSIRPHHGSSWAPKTRPDRLPATYRRTHGIRYFHGCYSLGDDQMWAVMRRRKGGDHSLAAYQSIRAARPDGAPIYIICDNLSANTTPAIRAWCSRNKVELVLTPTSASWANPIEAQFGPLRSFTMANSNYPNHTVLARDLQAYLRWRNAHARHPDVLAAQRRERARIRSERQQRWGRPQAMAA